MAKYKPMTMDEHTRTAEDLAILRRYLFKLFQKCTRHYPKSHEVIKELYKLEKAFKGLQSELDNEYCHTTRGRAEKYDCDYPYYGLDRIYTTMLSRGNIQVKESK